MPIVLAVLNREGSFERAKHAAAATGEAISDADLCQAAVEAFAGQYDADLGGYLFK